MKKISLRKVSDILSDKQMKAVVGGYGDDCSASNTSGSQTCCCGMGSNISCSYNKNINWVMCHCPSRGGCFM